MFNPEKILGGLLREGFGGSRGTGLKTGIGLGILGVAMEAADHFMKKSANASASGGTPPPPPGASTAPAPPPPPGAQSTPPPQPGNKASHMPAPAGSIPDPPDVDGLDTASESAVLLIRAMIAAANADGHIDAEERNRILTKLDALDLSPEERGFVATELLSPASLEDITSQAKDPKTTRQVYAVSFMTITVDTEAEQAYLASLAKGLGLDETTVAEIHRDLDIGK
jgi:uncharacterized membrane protein YebE (DUF533 family)